MKDHSVKGGGGIRLHVVETGTPRGKPILFIHGTSQCSLAWREQMRSDLANDFRLLAMDLRGHGASEKPRDVYGDSRLWADDVRAVIESLGLDRPLLCGWSYGGIVIGDYVAHCGEENVAGTVWVGAVWRLGDPLLRSGALGADFLAIVPGLFAEDVDTSTAALQTLIRLVLREEPPAEDFFLLLGYNTVVPPHVRQSLFSRTLDHDAVIRTMRKPMLLSYGESDVVVLPQTGRELARLAPHARLSMYPGAGHAPFLADPGRFNRELRELREAV
jgi:pimeloyl-ACP methyl ester carboxylesterase